MLLSGCAASGQPGRLQIIDDTERLDQDRIRRVATPLLEYGADLIVIMTDNGAHDALPQLQQLGMVQSGSIRPRGVAIYISMNPRYSELRVGEPWSDSISSARLRDMRLNILNPTLQANDPTAGVEAILTALAAQVAAHEAGNRRTIQLITGAVAVFALIIVGMIVRPRIAATTFGQALEQLWEQTPPGKHQARKRLQRQIAQSRSYLASSRQRAHSRLASLSIGRAALEAELSALDARNSALEQQTDNYTLPTALGELRLAYEGWIEKVDQLGREERNLASAMQLANENLNRLERSFTHAQQEPKQRKNKAAVTIKEEYKQQLAELREQYTSLQQEWQSWDSHDLSPQAQQYRKQLAARFTDLDQQTRGLWQLALPLAFAQYQREQLASSSSGISDSSSSSDSSWSSSSDSSWSSSSGSSWSSSSDSSWSSSSDSSDGGSW